MRILDISQPVGRATAVWPGDPPVELVWSQRRDRGDVVNAATITLGVHAGTHVDGALHLRDAAPGAGATSLEPFIGPARVVDARGFVPLDERILEAADLSGAERVLFRTRESVDPRRFPHGFTAIAPGLARRLAAAGVRLVGTDAPSVDPEESVSLEAHDALLAGGVAILENLVLDGIAPGDYFLVALPLRLEEADSSPVRAVLLEGTTL